MRKRVIRGLILGTLIGVSGVSCFYVESPSSRSTGHYQDIIGSLDAGSSNAYHHIAKETSWVEGLFYGIDGGLTNRGALSVRILSKRTNATEVFESLMSEATLEGRLYALCGLYHVNKSVFERYAANYTHNTNTVATISCDVQECQRISDIMRTPYEDTTNERRVVLRGNQTLGQWLEDWVGNETNRSYYLDISGGGYPSLFCDTVGFE